MLGTMSQTLKVHIVHIHLRKGQKQPKIVMFKIRTRSTAGGGVGSGRTGTAEVLVKVVS